MDASSPNHPSHSIKVSREAGNKHHIRYSCSAAIKSTRNGNELGLHVRILNGESLGRGIQHFSSMGKTERHVCCPCAGHARPQLWTKPRKGRTGAALAKMTAAATGFSPLNGTVKILLTAASLSWWILSQTWPRRKRKKTHEKPTR